MIATGNELGQAMWRAVELETLAKKLADEAISTNSERVSDYLNSQERRILHVAMTRAEERLVLSGAFEPDRWLDAPQAAAAIRLAIRISSRRSRIRRNTYASRIWGPM